MSIQSLSSSFLPAQEASQGMETANAVPVQRPIGTSSFPFETAKSYVREMKPDEMTRELSKVTQKMGAELSFSVDKELNKVVVTVTDLNTKEVIRQIPSQEMVALARRLKELESGGETRGLLVGIKG